MTRMQLWYRLRISRDTKWHSSIGTSTSLFLDRSTRERKEGAVSTSTSRIDAPFLLSRLWSELHQCHGFSASVNDFHLLGKFRSTCTREAKVPVGLPVSDLYIWLHQRSSSPNLGNYLRQEISFHIDKHAQFPKPSLKLAFITCTDSNQRPTLLT